MNKHFFSGVFMLSVGLLLLLFLIPLALTLLKNPLCGSFTNLLPSDCCSYSVSNWRGNNSQKPSASCDKRGTDDADEVHPNAKMRIGGFWRCLPSILSLWSFLVLF